MVEFRPQLNVERRQMFSNPLEKFERAEHPWLGFARLAGYAVIVASVHF
jgi:hypothetical protein